MPLLVKQNGEKVHFFYMPVLLKFDLQPFEKVPTVQLITFPAQCFYVINKDYIFCLFFNVQALSETILLVQNWNLFYEILVTSWLTLCFQGYCFISIVALIYIYIYRSYIIYEFTSPKRNSIPDKTKFRNNNYIRQTSTCIIKIYFAFLRL